jgi:outer membrane protein assembly factor BamB
VLPKPGFPAPAGGPGTGSAHFRILTSTPVDPGRITPSPKPQGVRITGPDGNTQHIVAGPGYAFDFKRYARPPRAASGEGAFVYEQVVYAAARGGTLYVETAHQTYASSSYGRNAYLNAVSVGQRKLLWRSRALVANARNFVVLNGTIVSGYGFTAEPDYLYALDRTTGKVKGRILLPSAPDRIARHGTILTVDTYDHRLTIEVTGA